jgi:hypothetical protein
MTSRTETQPVAGQRATTRRPPVADWFPPRYWRGIGTLIRVCAAVLILFCAMGGRG